MSSDDSLSWDDGVGCRYVLASVYGDGLRSSSGITPIATPRRLRLTLRGGCGRCGEEPPHGIDRLVELVVVEPVARVGNHLGAGVVKVIVEVVLPELGALEVRL